MKKYVNRVLSRKVLFWLRFMNKSQFKKVNYIDVNILTETQKPWL